MIKHGSAQEKILLLLLGGLALSLVKSPGGYFKIVKNIRAEWKKINRRSLTRSIANLYQSNLIKQRSNGDGTVTFILSKEGREVAMTYNFEEMVISKTKWDKKWRIVMFDIPEKLKKIRDTLRYQLKRLGFMELQRSVFVFPFECKNELEYIIEFYNIKKHVRLVEAHYIDNEFDLKHKFQLA
ncbi:MAG: CRISPR-associated endonuclease Cas2 [Candidatus Zambryskibacteria bacterium RIFCSPLOWO2_12_FULL_39_45]|uniref:CRISPR-associated endonuclease Cas2 n=3 Tax=Candidatus Zambryskiibacteriota TaxID=1817925 RepID=A0A1G2T6G1_9BACT|nr:MAG: Repressor in ring oxydation complex/ phenylacetic acid degradation pathway related protein (PaaX) [Parcubacteria group bacterium GW2011_GWA2_40_14]OHA92856.1 MAG: CRISPR-associated endonuclease Cas2 [Candidatus Zambryskibacteria bacterium RIFCSPHIGHO2_02_38_10.5]OHA97133.1 MAG: CRISPR-associated endonuclease Cas2 [Candidatus Zambryskibacteria bacterium RIFCSPHIGHO2_02_FULL_39_82]OHA99289.1 MAG: CRISPR-associated endonuclease Cas2 [Candidatus Zambryskibacteria bacterium RIFCSPHIGHO2_12_FU